MPDESAAFRALDFFEQRTDTDPRVEAAVRSWAFNDVDVLAQYRSQGQEHTGFVVTAGLVHELSAALTHARTFGLPGDAHRSFSKLVEIVLAALAATPGVIADHAAKVHLALAVEGMASDPRTVEQIEREQPGKDVRRVLWSYVERDIPAKSASLVPDVRRLLDEATTRRSIKRLVKRLEKSS